MASVLGGPNDRFSDLPEPLVASADHGTEVVALPNQPPALSPITAATVMGPTELMAALLVQLSKLKTIANAGYHLPKPHLPAPSLGASDDRFHSLLDDCCF